MTSRSKRWQEAASQAVEALTTLQEVQQEYEEWLENLPENLASSALGEKLEATVGIDIGYALDLAQEAENNELPQGFGRD